VVIKTTGDRVQDVALSKIGGKGLFVKEIEEALLEHRADVAVHSAKDLPVRVATGLALVAFPEREDPRDALVASAPCASIALLPAGARVGTGSARRSAQLRASRPDLEILPLRGNVPTRIAKLEREGLDAIVLASAGLDRLGLASRISCRIPVDEMLPAVCQGTLALEARADDPLGVAFGRLSDPEVALRTAAERAFLCRLEGDCTVPLAVFAEFSQAGSLRVRGLLASPDGKRVLRAEASGQAADSAAAARLGVEVAETVLSRGGDAVMRAIAEAGA
jgi:hydroxymethylbilane synthase